MKKKSALALTLGLGLAMGNLTMGTASIVHANQTPAEIQNMQIDNEKTNHQDMLKLLKIDEQAFQQEIQSGKSLAEIATARNVSREAVVKLVVKDMKQEIDTGLKEKRITKEQAKELKKNAPAEAQQMVDRQSVASGMQDRQIPQEILTLLQIDEQTFKQEQDNGKSLAEIAAAHNVSREAVVNLVGKDMNQQIDTGLKEKRITEAQANELRTNAIVEAQQMVDGKPVGSDRMQDRQIPQEMLTLLKIDEQTFKQEQNSGKSLAEIAAAHNVSREDIVNLVVKDMKQQIDTGLVEKRITEAQANELKINAPAEAQKIVDKNMVKQPVNPQ